MAHIAIIGAGIAGVPCAYELRKRLGKEHRVTLIGSSPYFEFTPSNPWMAVGWLAKVVFEKYFLRKVRTGSVTPTFEQCIFKALGIVSLKKVG